MLIVPKYDLEYAKAYAWHIALKVLDRVLRVCAIVGSHTPVRRRHADVSYSDSSSKEMS